MNNRYGGWLLAALSSIGVITTSILAANEAPKANAALQAKKEAKGEDLTLWETIKIVTPVYAPSLISGSLTIGSIFTNQALNSKQQTALIASGIIASGAAQEYDKYRRAIQAEQGEAVDARALERAKLTEEELRKEIARLKEECGPFFYCLSTLPGMIFEARPEDISDALLHFNRDLSIGGVNNLKELYTFIGIPKNCFDDNESQQYGWIELTDMVEYESPYCDFDIDIYYTKNDTPVRVITMPICPYDLNVNYDDGESTSDHFYPLYDPSRTIEIIQEWYQIPYEEVIQIDHPYLYRTGIF